MQRKPHTVLLLAVVVASLGAGAGCDKLRARDKLNKGVQAYKAGQTDLAIEDFKTAKDLDPGLTNARLYWPLLTPRSTFRAHLRLKIFATASRRRRNSKIFWRAIPVFPRLTG